LHLQSCPNYLRYFCPICYKQWATIPANKKVGHRYPTCCGTGVRFTCFKCAGVLSLASHDKVLLLLLLHLLLLRIPQTCFLLSFSSTIKHASLILLHGTRGCQRTGPQSVCDLLFFYFIFFFATFCCCCKIIEEKREKREKHQLIRWQKRQRGATQLFDEKI